MEINASRIHTSSATESAAFFFLNTLIRSTISGSERSSTAFPAEGQGRLSSAQAQVPLWFFDFSLEKSLLTHQNFERKLSCVQSRAKLCDPTVERQNCVGRRDAGGGKSLAGLDDRFRRDALAPDRKADAIDPDDAI